MWLNKNVTMINATLQLYIYIYIYRCGKNYLLIGIKQVQEKLYFKPYYLGGVTN